MQTHRTAGEMPGEAGAQVAISQVVVSGVPFWRAGPRLFPVIAGAEDGDGDGNVDSGAPPPTGKPAEGDDFDKDRAMATIRMLREKERTLSAQVKTLEPFKVKVEEFDRANQTEADRAKQDHAAEKQRADKLEQDLRQERTRSAVERAAAKAHLVDPDAAYRLLDLDAIEYGDDGRPQNVDKLVEQLAKDKPYLVGDTNPATARPGTGTRPAPAGTPGRDEQRKQAQQELAASGRYVL